MATARKSKPKKAVSKKSAAKKTGVRKLKAATKKATAKGKRKTKSLVKRTRDRLKSARGTSTRRRVAQLAVSIIDFQKATFDNTVDVIGKVQEQTGKSLHNLLKDASWMPGEGKEVVDEWIGSVRKSRKDFKRTMDKSFDLLVKYFERVKSEEGKKPAKKKKAKKKAAKKKAVKRGPKKAAAKKASAKVSPRRGR